MTKLQRALTDTRNAMAAALLDMGVDPLKTGAVMAHQERLEFYLMGLENRMARIESRATDDRAARRQRKGAKLYVLSGRPTEAPNPRL